MCSSKKWYSAEDFCEHSKVKGSSIQTTEILQYISSPPSCSLHDMLEDVLMAGRYLQGERDGICLVIKSAERVQVKMDFVNLSFHYFILYLQCS